MSNCRDELLALAEDLIKLSPYYDDGYGRYVCICCLEQDEMRGIPQEHAEHCIWKRAEKILEEIKNGDMD